MAQNPCNACNGLGYFNKVCPTCGGNGNMDVTCPNCINGQEQCSTCQGTGYADYPCDYCNATGQVTCSACQGVGHDEWLEPCNDCNQTGQVTCDFCGGTGNENKQCETCLGTLSLPCQNCGADGILENFEICSECVGEREVYDYECEICEGSGYIEMSQIQVGSNLRNKLVNFYSIAFPSTPNLKVLEFENNTVDYVISATGVPSPEGYELYAYGLLSGLDELSWALAGEVNFPNDKDYIVKTCIGVEGYYEDEFAGYTITFETNGGIVIEELTEQTNLPNPLPITTKQGYTFVDWYLDEELTIRAVAGTTIEANTTLYAKWYNLSTWKTDIANAIREKDGSTETIRDVDFPERILAIGNVTTGDYLIRFIDYDGTILKEQWVNAGEDATPPVVPTHEYLTFVEWNNLYTNIQRDVDIGATYRTTDGKTYAFVRVTPITTKNIQLYFNKSNTDALIVDWGDGFSNNYTNTGSFNVTHAYADYGDYIIKIHIVDTSMTYRFGNGGDGLQFEKTSKLYKLYIGINMISLYSYAFSGCRSLMSVMIPNNITSINLRVFNNCNRLKNIIIPNSVTAISEYVFYNCYNLESAVIPNSVVSIAVNIFGNCYNLKSIIIPNMVSTLGNAIFYQCTGLKKIIMPNNLTTVGNSTFSSCYNLESVIIPNNITSLDIGAFNNCFGIKYYIFEKTVPPTIGSNTFGGIVETTKIYVPDDSVTAYKTATNWVTYANYIYPISEYGGD